MFTDYWSIPQQSIQQVKFLKNLNKFFESQNWIFKFSLISLPVFHGFPRFTADNKKTKNKKQKTKNKKQKTKNKKPPKNM